LGLALTFKFFCFFLKIWLAKFQQRFRIICIYPKFLLLNRNPPNQA
jgi:hypothetical protein